MPWLSGPTKKSPCFEVGAKQCLSKCSRNYKCSRSCSVKERQKGLLVPWIVQGTINSSCDGRVSRDTQLSWHQHSTLVWRWFSTTWFESHSSLLLWLLCYDSWWVFWNILQNEHGLGIGGSKWAGLIRLNQTKCIPLPAPVSVTSVQCLERIKRSKSCLKTVKTVHRLAVEQDWISKRAAAQLPSEPMPWKMWLGRF